MALQALTERRKLLFQSLVGDQRIANDGKNDLAISPQLAYRVARPPSTDSVMPVMKLASGLAMNTIAAVKARASPVRMIPRNKPKLQPVGIPSATISYCAPLTCGRTPNHSSNPLTA